MPVARNVWQQMLSGRPGLSGPAFDHVQCVAAVQGLLGNLSLLVKAAEERSVLFVGDAGGVQVGVHVLLGVVVDGDVVMLAAFFVEAKPAAFALLVVVLHLHGDDGRDAGERVNHDADEGPVAEADDRAGVDGVQQLSGLLGGEHGRFALLDDVRGPSDRGRRIDRQDMADDQPVAQHANGGQVLLHRGRLLVFPERST